jgi:hypothetical protein
VVQQEAVDAVGEVEADDVAVVAEPEGLGEGSPREIDGLVPSGAAGAGAEEEAMGVAVLVEIVPGDLARAVDPVPEGRQGAGNVERRQVALAAAQEAVGGRAVRVLPDDVAGGVDSSRSRVGGSRELDEGDASAVRQVPMGVGIGVLRETDDGSACVDALGRGPVDRERAEVDVDDREGQRERGQGYDQDGRRGPGGPVTLRKGGVA